MKDFHQGYFVCIFFLSKFYTSLLSILYSKKTIKFVKSHAPSHKLFSKNE